MDILKIENVSKRYSTHTALDNVSLTVPRQSIFGLLGPNGAGKTSLIRIINQITGPDSGHVYFNGERLEPHHIGQIGYLPEERGLYKKMQVGEQALYLAQLKGLTRREALRKLRYWFDKLEIKPWWNKKVEELSKGMQQKVQFIVTVLHDPILLILDEPFSGFDPINANLVKNELLQLREKGTSIILSTHRMESVEEMCTHIALINKSTKILDGMVKDIRRANRSSIYEIEYSGNAIAFSTGLWTGFELIQNESAENNHYRARVRLLGNNTTNDLLRSLLQYVEVISFRELIPSMNDIFIAHVEKDKGDTLQKNKIHE
jgi:ABC-2 type transport system ATP-binding protein